MSFVKQVFGLAKTAIPVAVAVVAPVILIVRGPINLLSEIARTANRLGAPPQLAALGEPLTRLAIAFFAAIVGSILVGWMTRMFIDTLERDIAPQSDEPTRTYSIAWGAVTSFLYALSVVVGFMMLLVPGLVLLARGPLCVPVAVSEKVGPWRALSRSWKLTEGRHAPIQGILWLLLLIALVAVGIAVALVSWIPGANTNLGRSIFMTAGNAIGWSSCVATMCAAYVLLASEEKLGYLPAPPAGAPTKRTTSPDRSRSRYVWISAAVVCLCLLIGAWFALRPNEKLQPIADAPSDFSEEAKALIRSPKKSIGPKYRVAAPRLPASASHIFADTRREWKPRPTVGTTGHIVGNLVDADGFAVPGAEVEVILEDGWTPDRVTDPAVSGATDEEGAFQIGPVPSGSYTVRTIDTAEKYRGLGTRPITAVQVGAGDSARVSLELEAYVSAELSHPNTGTIYPRIRYFVQDGLHPLINGFSLGRLPFDRGETALEIRTFPGPLRFSPDPCFHPEAEVYTFEVKPDGSVHGPDSLPRTESVWTRVHVTRADGRPLRQGLVKVFPACTAPGSGASAYDLGGDLIGDRRTSRVSGQGYYRVRTSRGVVWRVMAVDEGSRVAESGPFVARGDEARVPIVLESASPARITFQVVGLPEGVADDVSPEDFTISFGSPRGIFAEAPSGWNVERSSNEVMSFGALPGGERIRIRFSYDKRVRFEAFTEATIEDGAHFELEASEVNPGPAPRMWAHRWWSNVEVGGAMWNLSVTPPPWLAVRDPDLPLLRLPGQGPER